MPKEDPNIEEAGEGHNSLSPSQLKKYIERIEVLIEDRKGVNAEIQQVYAEADINGYDKKQIKEMVKIRAMDDDDRQEQFELRDAYLAALGLL